MKIETVKGEARQPGNRHANQRLRKSGLVPAVIYGHNQPPESVALSRHDFDLALAHMQHVIRLQIGAKTEQYLIKEVQYDHLQKEPVHADLMRVDPNERVRVKSPVELRGTPKGAQDGGILVHVLANLEIECKLLEIPDSIRANVADLAIGQALHVKELELPAGVKALHAPEEIVAVVRAPAAAVETVAATPVEGAEATPAEPEVIGRVAKEKPEEAAGE